jgi:DNA-binding beta-propeller fold protein YncE
MKGFHPKHSASGSRRSSGAHARRRSRSHLAGTPWFRALVAASSVALATTVVTGSTWALLSDSASGGPEQLVSAALSPAPSAETVANNGCSGSNQQTNVGVSWTDSQSAVADASGGSLVSGYTVARAPAIGGPFTSAGTVTGSPAPTTYSDAPTVSNTPVALVANTANKAYSVSEKSLTAGTAITIGTTSNEVNAVQISPDGLSAVIAEYAAGQVQIITWSGSAWALATTIAVTSPTAVAIDPIPNVSGYYVAYVVSDPGTATNGSVRPITLNGPSSTLGGAIAVQHQANPTSIVVTPNGGTVYVANYNSSTVTAIATATSATTTVALPGTTPHPVAISTTFDSSHAYVADRANSYIDDITVATNTVGAHITLASGGLNDTVVTTSGNPNVLAVLPNGRSLYVAEFGAGVIQVINTALAGSPDTIAATISTGSGSAPIDLAASPNGCLIYGADWPSDNIFSINTNTNVETSIFSAACQTQDPQAIEVTPDNQYLFIPENYSCGDLQILDTATNVVTTVTGIGTAPTMVAIPPVPIWYQTTATHGQWSSNPSPPIKYPAGWNPGAWQ